MISSATWKPSVSGSCTSSRTRSGRSRHASMTAVAPSSASPTTSKPSASSRIRAVARNVPWSSTMRTVCDIAPSSVEVRLLSDHTAGSTNSVASPTGEAGPTGLSPGLFPTPPLRNRRHGPSARSSDRGGDTHGGRRGAGGSPGARAPGVHAAGARGAEQGRSRAARACRGTGRRVDLRGDRGRPRARVLARGAWRAAGDQRPGGRPGGASRAGASPLRRRAAPARIEDPERVQMDPLSVGSYPHLPQGRRILWATPYLRPQPADNAYARPIENLRACVDISSGEVLEVIDGEPVPLSTAEGNYDEAAVGGYRTRLRALDIV